MINVYTDGATVGHNGKLGTVSEVGLGIYITSHENGELEKLSIKCNGISNNEAEFMALIFAMDLVNKMKLKHTNIVFYLDSKIVVNRANGKKPKKLKYKNERMDNFQNIVLYLKEKIKKCNISFKWIPREQNTIADILSKQACGLVEKTPFKFTAPKKEAVKQPLF